VKSLLDKFKVEAKISRAAWLIAACIACVLLRGPSFRYGVISDDEAIYDTMAQDILAGGVMYQSTVDHKPPGIVYTYAGLERFAGNGEHRMAMVHVFGVLAALGTSLGLYWMGRIILAPPLEVIAPLLYAVTSAAKVPYDGLAVNGELLMNLPTAFAVACAIEATDRSKLQRYVLDVLAGSLVAVAVLYKYQAGILLCALPLVTLEAPTTKWWTRLTPWMIGFALTVTCCALYFCHRGALRDASHWGIAYNAEYISAGVPLAWAAQRLGRQLMGVVLPGGVLYVSAIVTLTRTRCGTESSYPIRRFRPFMVGWSLLSLASVAIGGRYFGHYFLQPELPLSIVAAGPAARFFLTWRAAFMAALSFPALVLALGATLPVQPGRWLDDDVVDYETLGKAVAARTKPSETIWVWGNAPRIYYVARRRSGVRFSFCNYLTGLSPGTPTEYTTGVEPSVRTNHYAWALVFEDLATRRPRLILDTASAHLKSYAKFPISHFPDLEEYLSAHYRSIGNVKGAVIYDRIQ